MSSNGSNGNGTTRDIVAKLWNLCHVLRDDGISYSDYVTELTFLLFLKMLAETGHEERLPKDYRWTGLARREGLDPSACMTLPGFCWYCRHRRCLGRDPICLILMRAPARQGGRLIRQDRDDADPTLFDEPLAAPRRDREY